MTRRRILVVLGLVVVVTTLSATAAAPWLIYWIALGGIEGRPWCRG
jgi:hypothetical protein